MGWTWGYSVLKRSEGGPGAQPMVLTARGAKVPGVTAESAPSPFVGHVAVHLTAPTKVALGKAVAALIRAGHLHGSVRGHLAWAVRG